MKRIAKLLLVSLLALAALVPLACQKGPGEKKGIDATILATGFVNLGTDASDPYRKWLLDHYGLNVTLNATKDFSGQSIIAFASNDKPDIVAFEDIDAFNTIFEQGVLLDDWTPYLDRMPNVKRNVERRDDDDPTGDSIAKQMMTGADGKLRAVWTVADVPTWSLKIREDWAEEYRGTASGGTGYPAGNVATDGKPWQPETPEDLLHFARWIKAAKPGCYAFTSAGGGSSLGTLGNWLPLMWGSVAELPYGAYINASGEVDFSILDGTHKEMLDYLKTLCSEQLIDPSWYVQSWTQKTKTQQGLIGIEWYPGAISTETESYNEKHDGSTADWWKTYDLPVAPGYETRGGYMPVEGYVGKILTVSKKAALNPEKMNAICRLFNDISVYYDEEAEHYVRPAAYDALRWGVGVEDGLAYLPVEGTDYVYLNTKSTEGNPKYYRETTAGTSAWDWGAWFATTNDGVIQGNVPAIDTITQKVIEHTERTANMKMRIQIGSSLSLDSSKIAELKAKQINYEYNYVTGERVDAYEIFLRKWRQDWGGMTLLAEAQRQFTAYGLMK